MYLAHEMSQSPAPPVLESKTECTYFHMSECSDDFMQTFFFTQQSTSDFNLCLSFRNVTFVCFIFKALSCSKKIAFVNYVIIQQPLDT